jgi:hypothetical protein
MLRRSSANLLLPDGLAGREAIPAVAVLGGGVGQTPVCFELGLDPDPSTGVLVGSAVGRRLKIAGVRGPDHRGAA